MNPSSNDELQNNDDKIDWNGLMPKTPKYHEINLFQNLLIIITVIITIFLGIFILTVGILGLWDGGTQ